MRHLILTLSLLVACHGSNQLGDDMTADIDGLRAVVQAHYDGGMAVEVEAV